ncbi:MAG: DNA primase [Bacteroidales bacterium]|nr:DNA primase [Bacteroidales bacterium]NPV35831.1 DNA primase [Bacteroidales bacterium]
MISQDLINQIIDTARIEEVIGEFVNLRRRGSNLIGLCPFHDEKTPSFTVSPVKGFYKCFGCGAGGNVVKFLMEHEHYSFVEAIKYLARKYNIEVVEKELTTEEQEAAAEKESLYDVTSMAADFFMYQLWETEEGRNIGLSYFEERGITHNMIRRFQLGYSPLQRDALVSYALAKGYKPELLEKAGLILKYGNSYIDRFRERVIFPIHNLSGRVIAFAGRILSNDKTLAKYINSPETDIYHKSNVLYGLSMARKAIAGADNCYLVEGYTDVISLHISGIENVVASSGTSLTTEQIRLIRRYTPNITILYDGDPAGIKASFRGIDMILKEGMNVRIVLFPEGEDPDSFARKHRSQEVADFIQNNAQHFIGFKTSLLLSEVKDDPIKKTSLIKDILSSIALVSDTIQRSEYIRYCARLLDTSEQVLYYELNKILRQIHSTTSHVESQTSEEEYIAPRQEEAPERNIYHQETNIIRLLLLYGKENFIFPIQLENGEQKEIEVNIQQFLITELLESEYEFQHPLYKKIFEEYCEAFHNNIIIEDQYFINHPDEAISDLAIKLITSPYSISPNWVVKAGISTRTERDLLKELSIQALLNLRIRNLELAIEQKQRELASANPDDALIILDQIKTLSQMKTEMALDLGRIILR